MRLIQEKLYSEKLHKLKTERANFMVSTMIARLLSIQASDKVEGGEVDKHLDSFVSTYQEGVAALLGNSRTKKDDTVQDEQKNIQNEKKKQFLRENVNSGKGFKTLDDIMQKYVNS